MNEFNQDLDFDFPASEAALASLSSKFGQEESLAAQAALYSALALSSKQCK